MITLRLDNNKIYLYQLTSVKKYNINKKAINNCLYYIYDILGDSQDFFECKDRILTKYGY